VSLIFQNARDWNLFVAKGAQQKPASIVVANDSDRQDVNTQISEVIRGIRATTGNNRAFAMAKDEHWGLARHARDFTDHEFIRNHVAQYRDCEPRKRLDDLAKMLGGLGRAGHESR
jgi:hypothetical protein